MVYGNSIVELLQKVGVYPQQDYSEPLFIIESLSKLSDLPDQSKLFTVFEQLVFPGLEKIEPDLFDLPSYQTYYFEKLLNKSSAFGDLITLLTPEHFKRRNYEMEQFIIHFKKLNCSRSILCMQVHTEQIYEMMKPLVIKLGNFLRATFVRCLSNFVLKITDVCTEYSKIIENIPDTVFG